VDKEDRCICYVEVCVVFTCVDNDLSSSSIDRLLVICEELTLSELFSAVLSTIMSQLPTGLLLWFDAVGWVSWPVKIVHEMTYKVSSGTLICWRGQHKAHVFCWVILFHFHSSGILNWEFEVVCESSAKRCLFAGSSLVGCLESSSLCQVERVYYWVVFCLEFYCKCSHLYSW